MIQKILPAMLSFYQLSRTCVETTLLLCSIELISVRYVYLMRDACVDFDELA